MKTLFLCSLLILTFSMVLPPDSFACTVCHSKNPQMKKMHEALQYKDCFKCHGPSSERKRPKAADEKAREVLCIPCHER